MYIKMEVFIMLKYYVLFIPLLGFSLIIGMQPKTQKNQFKGWRTFAREAYWGNEEAAQNNQNVTLRKATLQRQVAPSPKIGISNPVTYSKAPAVTVVIQETPQKTAPNNITTRKKTSSPKRVHTHTRTPMKWNPKKQLPAHLAIYFNDCVNTGHYEEALELRNALLSYGPVTMLNAAIKHPSRGNEILALYHLPQHIDTKQLKRTALFELRRKAALKKAQNNE
jgi:hypothetical protein